MAKMRCQFTGDAAALCMVFVYQNAGSTPIHRWFPDGVHESANDIAKRMSARAEHFVAAKTHSTALFVNRNCDASSLILRLR